MSTDLFERHHETLTAALNAIRERTHWSAYPEVPSGKIYGETARDDGLAAFEARLDKPFDIDQPGHTGSVGQEVSPYGKPLGVTYPKVDLDALLPAIEEAATGWRRCDVRQRAGVCLEILQRLNQRSFEIANAVMHTTGQGFMMAFQAGGPHAQDRGLEAVAYAYEEQTRCPAKVVWEKRVSKTDVVKLEKAYHIVPRGLAALVGCSTFPTWNAYPGLFASLATGNAVIVKPHPGAILPLAITVQVAREVLSEQGLDPNVVTLAADGSEAPITREVVTHPGVGIVDYTGGPEFGSWIEQHATQAVVFTETAGVNCVVLDSVEQLKPVVQNLAFSLSLYSGQMCTAPQNIFIPGDGIVAGGERLSFDEVAQALVGAVDGLLSDAGRACEVLGAVQNERTLHRVEVFAEGAGQVLRASSAVSNERFPDARVRSPLIMKLDADQRDVYMREAFGPIAFLVATQDSAHSLALAAEAARTLGAITAAVYSTDARILDSARDTLTAAGAALSCNLTGQIYVNQAAAFSDFHVSGANPAGNATLCDGAFVSNRFRVVQSRQPVSS